MCITCLGPKTSSKVKTWVWFASAPTISRKSSTSICFFFPGFVTVTDFCSSSATAHYTPRNIRTFLFRWTLFLLTAGSFWRRGLTLTTTRKLSAAFDPTDAFFLAAAGSILHCRRGSISIRHLPRPLSALRQRDGFSSDVHPYYFSPYCVSEGLERSKSDAPL